MDKDNELIELMRKIIRQGGMMSLEDLNRAWRLVGWGDDHQEGSRAAQERA